MRSQPPVNSLLSPSLSKVRSKAHSHPRPTKTKSQDVSPFQNHVAYLGNLSTCLKGKIGGEVGRLEEPQAWLGYGRRRAPAVQFFTTAGTIISLVVAATDLAAFNCIIGPVFNVNLRVASSVAMAEQQARRGIERPRRSMLPLCPTSDFAAALP